MFWHSVDPQTVTEHSEVKHATAMVAKAMMQYLTPSTMTTLRALFDETDDMYRAPFMTDLCPINDAFILEAVKKLKVEQSNRQESRQLIWTMVNILSLP